MPHLNPPQQPRSRRTLERLVTAALELLERDGPDGVTVQAVVQRANSSVGSFYARFGGKDDLLAYLGSRVWDEARERWDAAVEAEAWSDMSLAELASGAMGLLYDVRRSRADRLRTLDRMAGQGDAYERFRLHLVGSLETLLLARRSELAHPSPEVGVRVGLGAVLGVIESGARDPDGHPLAKQALVRECTDLLLAYLTGAQAAGTEESVEFFDVWG